MMSGETGLNFSGKFQKSVLSSDDTRVSEDPSVSFELLSISILEKRVEP